MNVFNRVLCKECLKLEPRAITKNFREELLRRLRTRVEGVCSKHGYIKHGSVELYKVAPGVIELATLAGNVIYEVYFHADICNPLVGNVFTAVVANVNRFGVLADAGYTHEGKQISVLDIIVAKNSVNIQSEVDLNAVKIGDELKIEIIGKKYDLGDKKISAIGRVVKDKGSDKSRKHACQALDVIPLTKDDDENEDDDEVQEVQEDPDEDESDVESSDEDEIEQSDEDDDDEENVKNGGSDFFSEDEASAAAFSDTFDDDLVEEEEDEEDKGVDY